MILKNLPYLEAIALHLKDSFPNSKIDVWSEESMFVNGYIDIVARVDDASAYTTVDPKFVVNEWHISDILVAKIKEVWNQCEFCKNRGLEDGNTLYISADWDGGIGFDFIRDIHYCPKCGRRL